MPTFGLTDNDGVDVGNKYVTKEYILNNYPSLSPSLVNSGLWSVGSNVVGGLGDGTTIDRSSPVTVVGGGNWIKISSKGASSFGIKSDYSLWSWGAAANGALGDNSTVNKSSPVTVVGGGTWIDCRSGTSNSSIAGLKSDGSIWTWGADTNGSLGDNGSTTSRSSPGTISGGGNSWIMIRASASNILALRNDGILYAWGRNVYGSVGDGTVASKSSPVTVLGSSTTNPWVSMSAGGDSNAAIKQDGTLWTWGANRIGQLGTGNTTQRSSPGTVAGGGTNWRQVAIDGSPTQTVTIATKTDGTLWTWGYNAFGQLGDGTTVNRSSPGTVAGGGTNWGSIVDINQDNAIGVLKTDGTLWLWGRNRFGNFGDNSTISRSSPQSISTFSNYVVAASLQGSIYLVNSDKSNW